MVAQQLERIAQADADSTGAATFTFEAVPQGLAWSGVVRVAGAPYTATMVAMVGTDDWGQWQGPLFNGPLRVDSNRQLQVLATALTPGAHYIATWRGVSDNADLVGPVTPTAAPPTAFGFKATQILSPFTQATQPFGLNPYNSPLFPVSNVKGIRVGVVNTSSAAGAPPSAVKFVWTAPDGTVVGVRTVIVAPGDGNLTGVGAFTHPNLGDTLQVQASTSDGSNLALALSVSLIDSERLTWSRIESNSGTGALPDRVLQGSGSVAAGATTVIAASSQMFAGPASWAVTPTGATLWQALLDAQDEGGAWNVICRVDNTNSTATGPGAVPIIVPPAPLRVRFNNQDGAAHNVTTSLIGDAWR